MKIVKMSLVAALLVGSSAFAIENIKVSGDAKLFYSTQDNDGDTTTTGSTDSLFDQASSAGQAALSLGLTADLTEGISAGTKMTALSTLGLENNLVSNVWEGTNGVSDSYIVNEAWIAGTMGKTTGKIGRMSLDTPLVFSEQWSIVANTFEAAVLVNQDIADTTLVAAYVGESNSGTGGAHTVGIANVVAQNNVANADTTFSSLYGGAYTVGAINNSFKPLTAQAWYYNVANAPATGSSIKAYWLQADVAVDGIMAGAQYSSNDLETGATSVDTNVYAVMLGYEMKDTFTAKVSYSRVSDENGASTLGAGGNLAGGQVAAQSKLYTEAWWNYGMVTQEDTKSCNVTLEAPVMGYDLGLYYTDVDQGTTAGDSDVTEFTASVSRSFGPLDASLVYINWDLPTATVGDDETTNALQVYLTYNF